MNFKIKPCPQLGTCLVCISPALAAGTASFPHAAACGCILLLSGCAAVFAVKIVSRIQRGILPIFTAVMISMAVSLGGELIASAAFPNIFENAPTFALTGAAFFFASCFSLSCAEKGTAQNLSCVLGAVLLIILLGAVRSLLSFLPLMKDISMGLILAGVITAVIRLLMPEKEENAWEA